MNQGNPPPAGSSVENSPASPARARLSAWERLVCVPLGFLWLAILLILAIPVCLYMTILHFAVRGALRVAGKGPAAYPARRSGTDGANQ